MRLIDADALKKNFGYNDEWYKSRTVTQIIDDAPTIEERPKGEWMNHGYDNEEDGLPEYVCPFCGKNVFENVYNYCPNCGARME